MVGVINSLKNTNTVGVDNISVRVVKYIANYIATRLAHIINEAVEQAVFPRDLKIGKVIPIFKKGDDKDMSNYRPITIPTVISKIIERAVYNKMMSFILKYKIITPCQNGFYPGRSTENATYSLCKYIYDSLDRGESVGGPFFSTYL
nr:unnamed protein product [Callosobruchus analis]